MSENRTTKSGGNVMTELFRRGYRDALLGDDWILEDMPPAYYDGVRKAKIEQSFLEN